MAEEFTTEQKQQLKTWAEQRDELLSGISVLKTEKEKLESKNKELASSRSEIEAAMNVIKGRIEELKIKEKELPEVISKEVAFFQSKKTSLESEITVLQKLLNVLQPQKEGLEADIANALAVFEVIKGETLLLDKVVDKVTVVSKQNTDKINTLVTGLAASLEEIIAVNKKNVQETNVVLDKLPRLLMDMQKRGLIKPKQSITK